jgi:branched-chain amino acid transport system permease protein
MVFLSPTSCCLQPTAAHIRKPTAYKVDRYKLLAFTLSAALAGLAGGLKALAMQVASLTDITWQMSGEVVLMTLLGGLGTLLGPVLGAGLVVTLESYLAKTSLPATAVIGAIFVVCVLTFRRGLYGEVRGWLTHRQGARAAVVPQSTSVSS